MARKIMVGMSGGVDSSVAAYLLKKQGYEVTGVTFKLWDDPTLESGCCSADDVRDAAYVCQQLGIPHYVLNYKDLFRQEVVGPFAEEYLRGRTPNPCISCNRYIKFGAFSHKLRELGFDLMATGHYACCGYNEATGRWELKRAIHPEKDQSYVLYNLTQEQLAMLRLPLGEYSKPEIRAIAEESGLVVAKKPDSQDICFVPDGDYNAFLRRWTGKELPAGQFVAEDGTVLGPNKGITHYTIGQRKGLGISLGCHAFVRRINAAENTVELTTEDSRQRGPARTAGSGSEDKICPPGGRGGYQPRPHPRYRSGGLYGSTTRPGARPGGGFLPRGVGHRRRNDIRYGGTDMLKDYLSSFAPQLHGHVELRAQISTSHAVAMLNGDLQSNARAQQGGVSARVYRNGVYGFASAVEYDEESVRRVLKAAEENALFLDARVKKNRPALPVLPSGMVAKDKEYIEVPQKDYIEFVRAADDYLKQKYPNLLSRRVLLRHDCMEKLLTVSDGTNSHSVRPRTHLVVQLTADAPDGMPVEIFDVLGGGEGVLTDHFTDPSKYYEKLDEQVELLMKKREGVFTNAGLKDVVLAPALAGILAHEAVGHTVEADLVLGGSVAAHNLGKRVATDLISMVDYAHTLPDGSRAPLPVYVDDEGTPASDEVLIKDGILVGYMNSRETAQHFGMEPHGNARGYAYSDEPLIRMRNTAILPGKDKLEDMIAAIDDGYYFTQTNNGQADTTGEFMFGIMMGYEIKNGKLGRAIRDTTISGVAFQMLQTVDMLSDDMVWSCSGTCGKKQPMPVGMGGPAVKCKVNVAGK